MTELRSYWRNARAIAFSGRKSPQGKLHFSKKNKMILIFWQWIIRKSSIDELNFEWKLWSEMKFATARRNWGMHVQCTGPRNANAPRSSISIHRCLLVKNLLKQVFEILFDRVLLITRRYYKLYFPYSWLVHGKIRKFRPCFQGPTESIGGYKAQQIIAWARPVSLSPNLTIIFRHLLVRLWFCGQSRLLTHTLRDILSNLFHSKFHRFKIFLLTSPPKRSL